MNIDEDYETIERKFVDTGRKLLDKFNVSLGDLKDILEDQLEADNSTTNRSD